MANRASNMSILMLPWLAHGHISPFLELAKKLSNRNFNIYLCSTPINLTSINKLITHKYSLSIQLIELHLPSSPELPPHYHTTNGLPPHLMPTLKHAFESSSPNFSTILKTLNPDLVFYDSNQPWVAAVASSRNIPAVLFLPFSAVPTSFGLHMLKKNPGELYPFPHIYLQQYDHSNKVHDASESTVNDTKDSDRFLEAFERSCKIILIKSFREIEGKYIEYLEELAGKKMVPVGPLVQDVVDDHEYTDIMQWLDKKEASSVVFVSFGSEYFLSDEERKEVAYGLELSKVNFIWVVRFPNSGERIRVEEALPEGFVERVGERGMVVEGWAPQGRILAHSSTGGFLSHCGWGSVMESMKFGVPIIGMPMHIDQPLNARVVEEVGVGVEVMREKNGRLGRDGVAEGIRKVVVEKSGGRKARELSETLSMKGEEEIDGVVEELLQLCRKRD